MRSGNPRKAGGAMPDCAVTGGPVPNHLRSALERGEFVCTAELVLGRDHNAAEAERFVRDASETLDGIRVISLTDLPGGNPALPPEAFASHVLNHKLSPIAHLSGKDGNRSFLEARLHALARLGVENVLALTGDAQKADAVGAPKPVHDLDSALILWLIRSMKSGLGYKIGDKVKQTTPFDFFAGAVVNPYKVREPDLMMQLYKLRLKVAAGAQFIVTQLGYDLRKLYELKQYIDREGLENIPVLANIYVPTARIARMMQSGEIAGCVISDELVKGLERENKAQRLERAALMLAAVKDLSFAGAHVGGFNLAFRDMMTILERASAIGGSWRGRIEELIYPYPQQFHLLPPAPNGLSDGVADYQTESLKPKPSLMQRLSRFFHDHFIHEDSSVGHFLAKRSKAQVVDDTPKDNLLNRVLSISAPYRRVTLGCVGCGDCVQDHLNYVGCSMHWCYKELRNGPCGGSRTDGACEARPEQSCIWNLIYSGTLAMGDDPRKFGAVLIPPRDWKLDRKNALVNRFAGLDNFEKRLHIDVSKKDKEPC